MKQSCQIYSLVGLQNRSLEFLAFQIPAWHVEFSSATWYGSFGGSCYSTLPQLWWCLDMAGLPRAHLREDESGSSEPCCLFQRSTESLWTGITRCGYYEWKLMLWLGIFCIIYLFTSQLSWSTLAKANSGFVSTFHRQESLETFVGLSIAKWPIAHLWKDGPWSRKCWESLIYDYFAISETRLPQINQKKDSDK